MTRTTVATTNDTITRCLSVRQPYAYAIVAGHKSIENRNSPMPYRGRVSIHASQSWGYRADDFNDDNDPFCEETILAEIGGYDRLKSTNPIFTKSAIIGSAVLTEVYPPGADVVFTDNPAEEYEDEIVLPHDWHCWANWEGYWIFADPHIYRKPIACKGRLNLWYLPEDLLRKVSAAERALRDPGTPGRKRG